METWGCFVGGLWKCLELLDGNDIECSELSGLFSGSSEDNAETNADDGGLACDVSEGSEDSIRASHVIL